MNELIRSEGLERLHSFFCILGKQQVIESNILHLKQLKQDKALCNKNMDTFSTRPIGPKIRELIRDRTRSTEGVEEAWISVVKMFRNYKN